MPKRSIPCVALAAMLLMPHGPAGAQGRPQVGLRDGEIVRGEARIAEMRRRGQLPDSFERGGCRYDLAGDPAAAYYVKTCP